jgi:hypothetical protein
LSTRNREPGHARRHALYPPDDHREPRRGREAPWHTHELGFQFVLVLRGWVTFDDQDIGQVTLRPGDSVLDRAFRRFRAAGGDLAGRVRDAGGGSAALTVSPRRDPS